MPQLNIRLTAHFAKDLNKFMRLRHINTKSEAVRIAIKEGIQRTFTQTKLINFTEWLGIAAEIPPNKNNKFSYNKDIWK